MVNIEKIRQALDALTSDKWNTHAERQRYVEDVVGAFEELSNQLAAAERKISDLDNRTGGLVRMGG